MIRISVLTVLLAAPLAGFANDSFNSLFTDGKVSAELSLGMLSGEAKERVYAPSEGGRKVSQLNWKYSNAAIIKGGLNWDVAPRATLGYSGWTTLAGKGGHMDDFDWMKADKNGWTDRSTHPDTTLNYGNEFDISMTGWVLKEEQYRLGLVAGYKQTSYSWSSRGGSYNYDEGTDIGNVADGERAIDYSQKFKIPYIGLTGLYRYEKFELAGSLKYSGWVHASDNDEHYSRTTTFKDKVRNQDYYSLTGSAGYYVTDNAKVFVEGTWNRMMNKKGNMSSYDYGEGVSESSASASGIEHSNYMINAGLKYTF